MGVIEFLNSLKTAQEQCKLSEEEFLNKLLAASTGYAHDLILEWKSNGMDTAAIFHNLLLNFDKRMSPDAAKEKLANFKVNKDTNLATAESQIIRLIGRAATIMPIGESRNTYYNLEGCNAFIRVLPPYNSQLASNLYNNYTAKLGRPYTLLELSQGLNLYRTSIDKDIKENGIANKINKLSRNNFKPKFAAYNIGTKSPGNGQLKRNRGTEISCTPRPRPLNNRYANRLGQNNYDSSNQESSVRYNRTGWNNKNGMNKYSKFNNNKGSKFTSRYKNDNKCPLCRKSDHPSTDCKNMINDQGKQIDIIPIYGTCSLCQPFVQPGLHHPDHLCPYRDRGIFNKKRKN
jgi:hypothetical protein